MRLFRLFLLLLFLPACSAVKTGYRVLDWAIEREVDNHLKLRRPQRKALRRDIDAYFDWHQKKMLPQYASQLRKVEAAIASGQFLKVINREEKRTQAMIAETIRRLIPAVARALSTADRDQSYRLDKRMLRQHSEVALKYEGYTEEQYKAERYEKTVKALDFWIGKLRPEQAKQLRSWSFGLSNQRAMWLKQVEKRKIGLLRLVRKRSKYPVLKEYLEGWWIYPQKGVSSEYRRKMDAWREEVKILISKLVGILNDKQKQQLRERLLGLAKDFEDLALEER